MQKAESVCKLKQLISWEIVNYEFRTEKRVGPIIKFNLLWAMTVMSGKKKEWGTGLKNGKVRKV